MEYLANMGNIDVNMQTGSLDIGILKRDKPFIIICSHGKVKLVDTVEHGNTIVETVKGKVVRTRYEEGELF